jgi:hypothetical protein
MGSRVHLVRRMSEIFKPARKMFRVTTIIIIINVNMQSVECQAEFCACSLPHDASLLDREEDGHM